MRVVVIGGGIIGVTTAYSLARAGASVVLIEAEDTLAEVTSYATGGHIAPGHSGAWASPRSLRTLVRSTYRRGLSYRLHPNLSPRFLRWALGFARNCTSERYWLNTKTKLRLALYSRDQLIALRDETGIAYDQAAQGALFFYRSEAGLQAAAARVPEFQHAGITLTVLRGADITGLDARLSRVAERVAGGLYSSLDEVGDTRTFALSLGALAVSEGASIRVSTRAHAFLHTGSIINSVETTGGTVEGDVFVLATGDHAPTLTGSVGLSLPIFPVRGYTVTAPARGEIVPPIGMVDEEGLVATARLGNRIRLGGTAEIGRLDRRVDRDGAQRLVKVASEMFPDGAEWDRAEPYVCLRPMTTDGPPILGRARFENLFLNVGHGHIGWTMACGAAAITRDLITGREPAIDLTGMTVDRFG